MRPMVAALIVLLGVPAGSAAQDPPLMAGRDVEPPRKVHAPVPVYPPMARAASLQGLILLDITLSPEGRPTDIKVLRGIPLLDRAAIEGVRTWRYEQTLVNDVPRRVVLMEGIDFFFSESDMVHAYLDIAGNRRQPAIVRLYAISRLQEFPPKRQKAVVKKLQTLLKDPGHAVAGAAQSALAKLPRSPR